MADFAGVLAAARVELGRYPVVLDALLGGLDAEAWSARPVATEWSPVEIVCHLRDEEVEDFGARLAVIRQGGARFAPIDPERWAVERRYRETAGPAALSAFRERRAATLTTLALLEPPELRHAVEDARGGRLSGLDLIAAWVAHDRLHLAQLAATLARTWATRWQPLRAGYAGPIPFERP